jgi:hypothetical protein
MLLKIGGRYYFFRGNEMINQYDIYAQFLVRCRQVMGPFDLDRLESDEVYKADFFKRVALSADDQIFALADLVRQTLNNESASIH